MREGQKSLVEQQQKEAQQNPTTPHGVGVHSSHLNHLTEDGSLAKRSSSRDSFSKDDRDSPILNLSNKSAHENNSDISAEDDVYVSDNEDDLGSNDEGTDASSIPKSKPNLGDVHVGHGAEKTEDKVNNNNGNGLPSTPGSQVRKRQNNCIYFGTSTWLVAHWTNIFQFAKNQDLISVSILY